MKITQTNDSELVIVNGGVGNLIAGIVITLVGIGVAVYPFIGTADWWVSLIGAAIAAFGALLTFTAATVTTTIRKTATSTISEKRLIGGRVKEVSFESIQVAHIKLESHTEYSSNSSASDRRSGEQTRQRVSELFAELKDGTEISLAKKRANANGGMSINGIGLSAISKAPLSKEGQQIADFLGVPLKTGLQDASLQDVVGAVQTAFGRGATPPTVAPTPQSPVPQAPTAASPEPQPQQPPVNPTLPRS